MSIVLVNHYAGDGKNGMEYRPYLMARRWVEMGEDVTIVASSFSHLRSKNPDLGDEPYRIEMIDGIRYVWIRGNAYEGNGVGRIRNMVSFVCGLYRYASLIVPENCDAIIASSTYPLDTYPVRKMARKCGAKFVFELHDMWPLSPIELKGMSPKHPYIMVMQKAENDWCRTADAVVSLLPAAAPYLTEHGMPADRFHYIPNGVDLQGWENKAPLSPDRRQAINAVRKNGDEFVIGYVGGHGLSNALDMLIDSVALLGDSNVRVVMVGDGPEKENLLRRVEEEKLADKIVMLPPVPKQQVPELLQEMDAAFMAMHPSPLYRFGVSPNKIMDYMLAAKPIVSAIDAANDYVEEAGCGISIHGGNPQAIADAMNQLASLPKEELEEMGARGREYIVSQNNYDVLARRFLEILKR